MNKMFRWLLGQYLMWQAWRREIRYLRYYTLVGQLNWLGRLFRLYDELFMKPDAEYKHEIGKLVLIKHWKKYGIIIWRWGQKSGSIIYEVKVNKHKYMFHEKYIEKTNCRMVSDVKIEELKLDKLSDGTRCITTKRKSWTRKEPYYNQSEPLSEWF